VNNVKELKNVCFSIIFVSNNNKNDNNPFIFKRKTAFEKKKIIAIPSHSSP